MTGKNYCKVEKKWCQHCRHHNCLFSNKTTPAELKTVHRCPKREMTRTIRVKDYIADADIDEVMEAMCKFWPEQMKSYNGYASVLEKLKNMKAIKTDWFVRVRHIHNAPRKSSYGDYIFPEEDYLSVDGMNAAKRFYAIEYVPWNEWLGMNILQETLDSLSKNEIIAGMLYEMTWSGFTEEEVQSDWNDLVEKFEECKKLVSK